MSNSAIVDGLRIPRALPTYSRVNGGCRALPISRANQQPRRKLHLSLAFDKAHVELSI